MINSTCPLMLSLCKTSRTYPSVLTDKTFYNKYFKWWLVYSCLPRLVFFSLAFVGTPLSFFACYRLYLSIGGNEYKITAPQYYSWSETTQDTFKWLNQCLLITSWCPSSNLAYYKLSATNNYFHCRLFCLLSKWLMELKTLELANIQHLRWKN